MLVLAGLALAFGGAAADALSGQLGQADVVCRERADRPHDLTETSVVRGRSQLVPMGTRCEYQRQPGARVVVLQPGWAGTAWTTAALLCLAGSATLGLVVFRDRS